MNSHLLFAPMVEQIINLAQTIVLPVFDPRDVTVDLFTQPLQPAHHVRLPVFFTTVTLWERVVAIRVEP